MSSTDTVFSTFFLFLQKTTCFEKLLLSLLFSYIKQRPRISISYYWHIWEPCISPQLAIYYIGFHNKSTTCFWIQLSHFLVDFCNFLLLETEMNTLLSRQKQCHFNLTTSPLYLVKLQIAQNRPTTYCSAFCWTSPVCAE